MPRATISRRDLIAAGATLSLAPAVRAFAADGAAGASSSGPPVLVSIFLRGGMDALSFIAPVDDKDFVADRPPELRLLADGPKPAIRLENAPQGLDFRIHPDAEPLVELYQQRRLGFVHAAGIGNGTRSHFGAQELIDRGLAAPEEGARIDGGWITRWLAATGNGATPAFSATIAVPQSLERHPDTICSPDIRQGLALPGGKPVEAVLAGLYPAVMARAASPAAVGPAAVSAASARVLSGIGLIDQRVRGPDGKVLPYAPAGNAVYEETEIGRSLQTVARVIKMDLPVRAFAVDMGGWDTHESQPPRFAALIGQLARAMAAFHADLADRLDRITLVATSEFGRRLRSNKSNGTDHGHGGVVMVSAPRIKGGIVHGRWPGLATEQLDNRVDLAVTTDIRAILAELMAGPLATPEAASFVFPGFKPARIGLLA